MVPVGGPFLEITLFLNGVFLQETLFLDDELKPYFKHIVQDKKYDNRDKIPCKIHLNVPFLGDQTTGSEVLRHQGD
jgi:hypothetical protein